MSKKNIKKPPARRYTEEDLQRAVHDVTNKLKSYREAKAAYNIPISVIYNRISGRKNECSLLNAGRPQFFTKEEESELVKCVVARAQMGHPYDKKEFLSLVSEYCKNTKQLRNVTPGERWYRNFMKRNPILALKKAPNSKQARVDATYPSIVYDFYDELSTTFSDLSLSSSDPDSANFIFNCNEVRFERAIGEEPSELHSVYGGSGEDSISVLGCVSAGGTVLPPMIIFKGVSVLSKWISDKGYPGTTYMVTEQGWMTEEVFHSWFEKSFIVHVEKIRTELGNPENPAVLIFNGDSSYVSLQILQLALRNNVTMITLQNHSMELLQILDEAIFGPVKSAWQFRLVEYGKEKLCVGSMTISKCEFIELLGGVWTEAMTEDIIKNGFASIGLFPVNKALYPKDKFNPNDMKNHERAKVTRKVTKVLSPTIENITPILSSEKYSMPHSSTSVTFTCPSFDAFTSIDTSSISPIVTEETEDLISPTKPIDLRISISRPPSNVEEMNDLTSAIAVFCQALKEKIEKKESVEKLS